MPNPTNSGLLGDPWHRCDRCGVEWRCSQLQRALGLFKGILVCPDCVDKYDVESRDRVIKEVLSNSSNEMDVAPILKAPVDSLPDLES